MLYTKIGNTVRGPFSDDELRLMLSRGEFSTFHKVSVDKTSWESADAIVFRLQGRIEAEKGGSKVGGKKESEQQWHFSKNGEKKGPVTIDALMAMLSSGEINGDVLVFGPGFSEWVELKRVSQLAILFGLKNGRRRAWVSISILGFVCLGLSLIGFRILFFPSAENNASKLIVTSATDTDKIRKAVGNLVLFLVDRTDGEAKYYLQGNGTAFAVSPDGYFVTNRHVVADCGPDKICVFNPDDKPADQVSVKGDVIPIMFLDGVQWDVEIKHVNEQFDLAIVKIVRNSPGPFFRLASSEPEFVPFEEVYASGFPGASNDPTNAEEGLLKISAIVSGVSSPASAILPREKVLTPSKGYFQRIHSDNKGVKSIEHRADFSPGNSGGPLYTNAGIVIGINTYVSKTASANFSPEISQMRAVIDDHVVGVIWH